MNWWDKSDALISSHHLALYGLMTSQVVAHLGYNAVKSAVRLFIKDFVSPARPLHYSEYQHLSNSTDGKFLFCHLP